MRQVRKTFFITLITCAVFVMCMLFSSAKSYADVIWEPEDDNFFEHHRSECGHVDRTFTANPPEGELLVVYETPDSTHVITTIERGEYVGISHSYTDPAGNKWGLLYSRGWVPMDYLAETYDGTTFYNQYSDQISSEDGEADISKVPEDKDVFFYSYPGAQSGYTVFKGDNPYYTMTFTDPEGHKWGYVSYYYISEGWICIDAPDATYEELYPNGQSFSGEVGEIKAPEKKVAPIPGPFGGIPVPLIIGIAVAVIVVITAVILIVVSVNIKKKKKSKQN